MDRLLQGSDEPIPKLRNRALPFTSLSVSFYFLGGSVSRYLARPSFCENEMLLFLAFARAPGPRLFSNTSYRVFSLDSPACLIFFDFLSRFSSHSSDSSQYSVRRVFSFRFSRVRGPSCGFAGVFRRVLEFRVSILTSGKRHQRVPFSLQSVQVSADSHPSTEKFAFKDPCALFLRNCFQSQCLDTRGTYCD